MKQPCRLSPLQLLDLATRSHIALTLGVPSTHDDPPIRRIRLDLLHHLRKLIHALPPVIILASAVLSPEVAPLEPINWPQIPLAPVPQPNAVQELPAPIAVPDMHPLVLEEPGIGGARDEPEELFDDAAPEDPLCCEEGEAFREVEAERRRREEG